jgi:membrane fusion protein, multidrug efflux system|tara:strand:- start:3473 stop:4528 length:1056 start_codon:yes stop_codon:yes gene_type:complete
MRLLFLHFILLFLISGCTSKEVEEKKPSKEVFITTSEVKMMIFEDQESAIGSIEGLIDTTVSAEISGKVTKIYPTTGTAVNKGDLLAEIEVNDYQYQLNLASAEVRRLGARYSNQQKIYDRNAALVEKKFISPNALDEILTTKAEIQEELEISKSRLDIAKSNFNRTKIYSPITGKIQKRIASVGDYLKIGDGVFQIINNKKLRAHIPFPEKFASQLKPGINIKLITPVSATEVNSKISELKPMITEDNRSIDVIADISGQDDWQSGASVKGTVSFASRQNLGIPEQSLVLRPAGEIVYIIKNNIAEERKVTIGISQNGLIEVTSGLSAGDIIALDGASYLTNQATVNFSK